MAVLTQDDLLEAIDKMTVLELSEFIKRFEERYGVTAAAPAAAAAAPAAGGGAARGRRRARGADRVHRDPDRDRPEQDPGHQGRPRADRSRPQGGQGPRRRVAQGRQGRRRPRTKPRRSRPPSRSRAPRSRSSNADTGRRWGGPWRALPAARGRSRTFRCARFRARSAPSPGPPERRILGRPSERRDAAARSADRLHYHVSGAFDKMRNRGILLLL